MDHSGRAFKSALRQVFWGLIRVLALPSARMITAFLGHLIAAVSWGWVGSWADTPMLIFLPLVREHRRGILQFGSRCELFLPLSAEVKVRPGDAIRGGETIVACFA